MDRDFRFAQRVVSCVAVLPWLGLSILAVLILSSALLGQTSQGSQAVVSLPTDWSHHHLLFSNPATAEQLKRVQQDPRYWQQLFRRSQATPPEAELDVARTSELQSGSKTSHASKNHKLKRDWSESLGAAGATVGAGQYPGKFGFDVTTYNCTTDFVVFNTGLAGSGTQASIIAYNNLYTGCGGTVPKVYWAYNTGGTISTSVTLSADGSQLAFVQQQGGKATLVLLYWKASTTETVGNPGTPTSEAAASYRGCTAPCMTTMLFDHGNSDTYSAPFYDFTAGSDTLYAGDDAGLLHQFTGVFLGATPKESTIAPWPVNLGVGTDLSGPVYDPTTGNVFVTTSYSAANNNGGVLAAVCATSTCAGVSNGHATTVIGTVTPSGVLGPDQTAHAGCRNGIDTTKGSNLRLDSPIVDPVAGMVYAFLGNDGSGNSAVIQFPATVSTTEFSYHSCGTESTVGTGSTTGVPLFAGTFDNAYFTSSGSSPSGNLYVCGDTSADATLYQVPINANAIKASTSVVAVSSAGTTCSPVTEVYNNTNDFIFLSAEASGASTSCTAGVGGCIYSSNVTPWQPLTGYSVGQEILDTNFQIQVVETAGTSKSGTAPTWSTTTGGTTTDGTVTWLNQGLLSTTITTAAFATLTFYGPGTVVIDGNGNIELCTGTFGCIDLTQPTWATAPGAITNATFGTWENLGPDGIPALSAAGGTSGIIIDNTVPPGTEAGASQIYFSTLTGETAVQASQAALK